ncbi:hypothetical protein DRO56_03885 [Candidatus Bathyarchaeota archaeon]|nr:MAG: hypothetical protein DRO56_03885 [Candidatus Bathyarchaeota archaeon]
MARILSREDLLAIPRGGMALATGGGGVRPLEEVVEKMVDDALDQGKEFKLVTLEEIPDDVVVLSGIGTGGGIRVEQKLRWMNLPGFFAASGGVLRTGFDGLTFIHDQIKLKDKTFAPLNSWSELPGPDWAEAGLKRLKEIIGDKKIFSQLLGEINQMIIRSLIRYPDRGWPIIDAAGAGHRAVPECSITSLNIHDVPVCPAVITTSWGDLLVLEKTLSWQRAEEIVEGISTYSGGTAGGPLAVEGKVMKKAAIPGAMSFTIKIGKAINKAVESGDDPIEAMIKASDGWAYKVFEGKVTALLFEEKYGFIWGYSLLKGTGEWEGHHLKIWFKNENHISWLDEKPYITSPDGLNVIDPKTGWGLSNFWTSEWEYGREVVVVGVRAEDIWRTEKGLKLLGPKHFGYDIPYKPIEEIVG